MNNCASTRDSTLDWRRTAGPEQCTTDRDSSNASTTMSCKSTRPHQADQVLSPTSRFRWLRRSWIAVSGFRLLTNTRVTVVSSHTRWSIRSRKLLTSLTEEGSLKNADPQLIKPLEYSVLALSVLNPYKLLEFSYRCNRLLITSRTRPWSPLCIFAIKVSLAACLLPALTNSSTTCIYLLQLHITILLSRELRALHQNFPSRRT